MVVTSILMVREAEHLFMCLLATCIFFGEMSIELFCHFSIIVLVVVVVELTECQ